MQSRDDLIVLYRSMDLAQDKEYKLISSTDIIVGGMMLFPGGKSTKKYTSNMVLVKPLWISLTALIPGTLIRLQPLEPMTAEVDEELGPRFAALWRKLPIELKFNDFDCLATDHLFPPESRGILYQNLFDD